MKARFVMLKNRSHNIKVVGVLVALLISLSGLKAQEELPAFERLITINLHKSTLEAALTEIGRQAEITFSYNPSVISASDEITLTLENQTVRYALNTIFGGTISYRQRGKFVILQPVKAQKNNSSAIIEGYLSGDRGNSLSDATVYSAVNKTAVTTNEFGYFRLEVDSKRKSDTVRVSKRGYEDALLMPVPGKISFVKVTLNENNANNALESQPVFYPAAFVNRKLKVNSINISETFDRFFQLSLVPYLGTNRLLSGSTSNLFSLNILGGYIESVKAFEIGGVVNIVRHNAGVLEGAGVANFVGGNFNGFQFASVINKTKGHFNGFQAAGLINRVGDRFNGLNLSGGCNLVKLNFNGFQIAGIWNSVGLNLTGVQIASAGNVVKEASGLQMSAIFNHASKVKGAQITGVINIADTINGMQLSGLINKAKYVKGLQLGVINIADSSNGVSFGLINVIKNGYHQVDIYSTETFYMNVAYRGGTRKFYNIFMGGYDPRTVGSSGLYTYGVGAGTSFGAGSKLNYDLDLIAQQVGKGGQIDQINMLYNLGYTANWMLNPKIRLLLGLTYNFYLVDSSTPQYETTFSQLPPYFISNETAGTNRNIKTWIGFKAGIRLF